LPEFGEVPCRLGGRGTQKAFEPLDLRSRLSVETGSGGLLPCPELPRLLRPLVPVGYGGDLLSLVGVLIEYRVACPLASFPVASPSSGLRGNLFPDRHHPITPGATSSWGVRTAAPLHR
jgi:hypothetical protein